MKNMLNTQVTSAAEVTIDKWKAWVYTVSMKTISKTDNKIDYNKAKSFFHCKKCMDNFIDSPLHSVMTPRDYGSYEVNFNVFF